MSHRCPAAGCTQRVRDDLWSCRAHWWQLPASIRGRLLRPADEAAARADAERFWRSQYDTPTKENRDA